MKKIFYTIIATISIFGATSCSDMLDVESTRQIENPALTENTDSVFYAYGILQAMQQLADQYFFQNEVRGDLVKVTDKANVNLKNLADYSADATNKYDSVYLYYKVINNCNYYLKNRETDAQVGDTYIRANEYVSVAAIRAWAYLQLMRNYGDAPYITEPITTISEVNANHPSKPMKEVLAAEAKNLEDVIAKWGPEYLDRPTYGKADNPVSLGNTNWGQSKQMLPSMCFFPINVVLGDLYLEIGEYEKAATTFYNYLYAEAIKNVANISVNYSSVVSPRDREEDFELPEDFDVAQNNALYAGVPSWDNIFMNSTPPGDVITYIPMATTQTNGQTTLIPETFGYLYYEPSGDKISMYSLNNALPETADIQLVPSASYDNLSQNNLFYYVQEKASTSQQYFNHVSAKLGDARRNFISHGQGADSAAVFVQKPATGNVYLYRNTTVLLHLAEALNRMGCPDAAFAILKDGMTSTLTAYVDTLFSYQSTSVTAQTYPQENFYITTATADVLSTKVPFLANPTVFHAGTYARGIHSHGGGDVAGLMSPYQYATEISNKIAQLNEKFGLGIGEPTVQDKINAMEDILCDEYALEFAFEGTRFADLQRIARHKNESGLYGGNFGSRWLADKLAANNPKKDLLNPENWYLPF